MTTTKTSHTRRIYNAITQNAADTNNPWAGLAELRENVGLSRPDFDTALHQLKRARWIVLIPEANQKALTHADREAAVWVGDEPKHLACIATGPDEYRTAFPS